MGPVDVAATAVGGILAAALVAVLAWSIRGLRTGWYRSLIARYHEEASSDQILELMERSDPGTKELETLLARHILSVCGKRLLDVLVRQANTKGARQLRMNLEKLGFEVSSAAYPPQTMVLLIPPSDRRRRRFGLEPAVRVVEEAEGLNLNLVVRSAGRQLQFSDPAFAVTEAELCWIDTSAPKGA